MVITIVLACSLAGVGTMAYFTSRATSSENAFTAGTLKLGGIIDGADVVEKFARLNIDNLQPDNPTLMGTTELKNVGTLPFRLYRITASNITGQYELLDPKVKIEIKIAGEHVYSGTIKQLQEANGGYFDPIYNVQPGEVKNMEVFATLDKSANNDYQGKSMMCDLTVYATQNNAPINGAPIGSRVNMGSAKGFSVDGYNTENYVNFDWDWKPDDISYEKYVITIKHETGDPTTQIEEWRITLFKGEKVVSTDGINKKDVDVDWDGDIVKIKRTAFPKYWAGFEVKLGGEHNSIPTPKYEEIPYQYWSLAK